MLSFFSHKDNTPEQEVKRRRRNRRIIRWMWGTFGFIVLAVLIFFVLIYHGVIGYMPDVEQLRAPQDKYASIIYTADGEEMGRFYRSTGNRVYADYSDISENVINALIATEDARYMDHSGIDGRALVRVLFKTLILQQRNAGGGSTITQQLAKQLYTLDNEHHDSRALQKLVEWMIAIKLERMYSKQEIIKMYLNQFDFLYNAVGIQSAAQVYFGKDAKDLDLAEAATLVGMVKNPSYYNPRRHNERTLARRNTVLQQMQKAGMITSAQYDSVSALPLVLDYHSADHKEGIAPYFREELRRYLTAKKPVRSNYPEWDQQKFVDDSILYATNDLFGWVEKNPKSDGTYWDIYNDGLKINTTIDSRMQRYAEEAVHEHLSDLQGRFFAEKRRSPTAPYAGVSVDQFNANIDRAIRHSERHRVAKVAGKTDAEIQREFNTPVEMNVFSYRGEIDTVMTPRDSIIYTKHFLRAGFMAMDPTTGYVKAYVGGPNFKHFQYDMVSTGRRQIGSTIKPYLYTVAMQQGMTPCTQFLNSQPTLTDQAGRPWSPRNAGDSRLDEMVDLRWALTTSNNWISARVIDQVRPEPVVRLMHRLGITNHLPAVVSLCLGPCEVSVKEMVTGYSAFANHGVKAEPVFVTSIVDQNGRVISRFAPNTELVIQPQAHNRMLDLLTSVVRSGTGSRLYRAPFNLTAQIGGKTGTTNDNSDGWFMGFTPDLVAGTWVGGEERAIHFNTMANAQGAASALPIFGKFMKKVFSDSSLPYTQSSQFDIDYTGICDGIEYVGEAPENEEESVEGIFD